MKKFYTSLLLMSFCLSGMAQMYINTNVAAGNNSFPFNTTTSRKVQWRILANSLGTLGPGNNITMVYFQCGNTATMNYPLLNISLKQGPPQFAGAGLYETGMTVVYSGTNVTVSSTTGGWISFALSTPFLYNPSLPLFVEVEHNATTGAGPTVYQNSPVGPGNGRQYGNYPNASYTGADATVVNFGVDVIPATPCTGAPPGNTIIPMNFTTCPMLANPSLSVAATYSLGGLSYQWLSSTISPVGPFSAMPGATLATAPTPTISQTTWYQAVVTCTNPGGGSVTLTPTQFFVSGSVSATVPYYEDFETVQVPNRLPNCSWWAPNLGGTVKTYISSQSGNRVPKSGSNFGTFEAPTSNNYVYSNGVSMVPGITYSAAIWYATEYFGYSNWTNLSLFVGTAQTPASMSLIATVAPAISGPYKLLSGVFTVPAAADYYIGIRANGASGSAAYLMFDDLSVTIPCQGAGAVNSPTVILSPSATTVCAGDALNINATGADTYSWSNGFAGNPMLDNPQQTTNYTVIATNTITGCSQILVQPIVVNPSPNVFAVVDKPEVCKGQTAYLTGYNASSYNWSNGAATNPAGVTLTTTSTFTLIGTNLLGCSKSAVVTVSVKASPTISVLNGNNAEICEGEFATFSANGGQTYQWLSNSSPVLYQGNQLNVKLMSTTTFTVIGTGANGCNGNATVSQNVAACTGLSGRTANATWLVYPNPTTDQLNFVSDGAAIQQVDIIDVAGRVLISAAAISDHTVVDVSTLPAGLYYARISAGQSSQVIKIVRE